VAPYQNNPAGTTLAATATRLSQYIFAQGFAGITPQLKTAAVAQVFGNSAANLIRVDTAGVFEFPMTSTATTIQPGGWVGMDTTGSTGPLLNQQVIAVPHPSMAIGSAVFQTTSSTTVLVRLLSKLFKSQG